MGDIFKLGEDWKKQFGEDRHFVLKKKITERPFSSNLVNNKEKGTYLCKSCGNVLFNSEDKFDSGTGWPSFLKPLEGKLEYREDKSMGTNRIEVLCRNCKSHLGHVFEDGPLPLGKRYCINGESLNFLGEK